MMLRRCRVTASVKQLRAISIARDISGMVVEVAKNYDDGWAIIEVEPPQEKKDIGIKALPEGYHILEKYLSEIK